MRNHTVRISDEMSAELDAFVAQRSRQREGLKRADVIRELLRDALDRAASFAPSRPIAGGSTSKKKRGAQ